MKNKILSTLCIFILLSFVFINNNIYASNTDVYNTIPEHMQFIIDSSKMPELNDSSYKCFIWYNDYIGYVCWFFKNCSDDFAIYYNESNSHWYRRGSATECVEYVYNASGEFTSSDMNKTFTTDALLMDRVYYGIFYLKNITIYKDSNYSEIFFQPSPVTRTLAPILEKVEMKEPIITTIVGLAKLLIPLLICLIAFWKAWRLLSRILHKS